MGDDEPGMRDAYMSQGCGMLTVGDDEPGMRDAYSEETRATAITHTRPRYGTPVAVAGAGACTHRGQMLHGPHGPDS